MLLRYKLLLHSEAVYRKHHFYCYSGGDFVLVFGTFCININCRMFRLFKFGSFYLKTPEFVSDFLYSDHDSSTSWFSHFHDGVWKWIEGFKCPKIKLESFNRRPFDSMHVLLLSYCGWKTQSNAEMSMLGFTLKI